MENNSINKNNIEVYPVALTIAGSDSGGGAGIQADLRTFSSFGVYGTSAITAVTSQNPCEVRNIAPLSPEVVRAQLDTVFAKLVVGSIKTGMLHDSGIIEAIANSLKGRGIPLIVDPVMVSTSGSDLLKESALNGLRDFLLPLADWVTPNVVEAEALLECKIESLSDMKDSALAISEKWNCVSVIKGGDFKAAGKGAIDIVASRGQLYKLSTKRVKFPSEVASTVSHGTGCTFSAALAAGMVLGLSWKDVLVSAKAFVYGSLSESIMIGDGIGAMYPPSGAYRDKVTFLKLEA